MPSLRGNHARENSRAYYPDRTVGPGGAAGGSSQPRDAGTADGQAAGEGLRTAAAQTAQLARFSERDPLRLADLLIPSVDAFLEAALARQGGERILTGTGGGSRYRLQVDDGTATVTAAGRPVDCWISADPTTFLLLGYGRISRRSQLVRGRIVAGGRRPWLAVAFERLLTGP